MAAISPQLLANQLELLHSILPPDAIIHTGWVELDKLKGVLQEEKDQRTQLEKQLSEMELRQKHLLLRESGQ